jgi:type IV pilus assembly protein PilE
MMKRRAQGFTLIEMMVTVAIIGILTAVAVPAYSNYVLRARTNEAFTVLSGMGPVAEQYWANNRSYASLPATPAETPNFTYLVSGTSNSTYVVTATGRNRMLGFKYTINESGTRVTSELPPALIAAGWTKSTTCWVDRKGGLCAE